MDKVSVIVTTQCLDRHIFKCIDSIKNQTYKNIDIIVVIDSNNIPIECRELISLCRSNSIQVVANFKNMGTGASRNIGYSKISNDTKYVMFHDDDDFMYSNKIEYLVSYLKSNLSVDFVGSLIEPIDDKYNKLDISDLGDGKLSPNHKKFMGYTDIYYNSHNINCFIPSTVLLRKSVCDIFVPFKNVYDEDYEFFTRLLMFGIMGLNLPVVLTQKMFHYNSKTSKRNETADKQRSDIKSRYKNYITKEMDSIKYNIAIFMIDRGELDLEKSIKSIKNKFQPTNNISIFTITDNNYSFICNNVIKIHQDDSSVFKSMDIILTNKKSYESYDYLYFFDCNILCLYDVYNYINKDIVRFTDHKEGTISHIPFGGSYYYFMGILDYYLNGIDNVYTDDIAETIVLDESYNYDLSSDDVKIKHRVPVIARGDYGF